MIFFVNASKIFEKGDSKDFIREAGIQRVHMVSVLDRSSYFWQAS